ncbi:MFS transporter [Eggerthella guodeyinii]|uniref:MFS transporter n=2 Tax=Eggerthella TaxID=84111 RepID=A0A6L7IP80_9ACTN|nr:MULTISPECIES: MFS transporter [Eggerthella]MBC5584202.1 MFS transporter [Eggerthella hominis]QOS67864.1 MFS transporter [Eggerthella guodeyinii]
MNQKNPAASKEGTVEKFLVLPILVLIMAQMGTSGDNGALGLANTELVNILGATTPDIQLANMVYSLMAGAFMIAGGLVGTIIGWRKNFRMGAALCAAGELVMALSPNMTVFIWGGRILVGFGASFMIPSVLGLIPHIYHGKNRMLAFGCIGAASGLSAFLPLFLGIIMQVGGFRITYGVLAVYFVLVLVMSLKIPAIEKSTEKLKFDGIGTGLAAVGLFLFLIGLSRISAWGLIEPFAGCPFTIFGISPALPMAALGLIVLVVLVFVEKRVEAKNGIALIPQSFLKTPQVRAGLIASAITFFFMGLQAILLSPYLQLVAGWSPMLMGVSALAVGIPTFLFSMGIPKFIPNANPRRVIQIGYCVMALAFIPMGLSLQGSVVTPLMWVGLAVAGAGAGIVSSHTNNIVALAVNERDASQSGGIQTTMRNVGQAIGVAAVGAVLLFGITSNINSAMDANPTITPAVRAAVSERNLTLMGDSQFEQAIADIPMSDTEKAELVAINSQARVNSTITGYGVSAVVILAGLITTRWITVFKKEEEGATAAAAAPVATAGDEDLEPTPV